MIFWLTLALLALIKALLGFSMKQGGFGWLYVAMGFLVGAWLS